jgi:hypothetical protein
VRRRLAIALQQNTDDHYDELTYIKKFLTYVNVKLPVIDKVLRHICALSEDTSVAGRLKQFADAATQARFESVMALKQARTDNHHSMLLPMELCDQLTALFQRLPKLYDENSKEVAVVSDELSRVLEGTMLSANVGLLTRQVDTALTTLELDRTAKNRANALKILSVVLGLSLAGSLAADVGFTGSQKWVVATLLTVLGGAILEVYIRLNSHYFRLVLPINRMVNREALERLLTSRQLSRIDQHGSRQVAAFKHRFAMGGQTTTISRRFLGRMLAGAVRRLVPRKQFDLAIDYERRGYIKSLTLATEYYLRDFDLAHLIREVVNELWIHQRLGMTTPNGQLANTPFIEVLNEAGVLLDIRYPALNRLLSLSTSELESMFRVARHLHVVPDTDRSFLEELASQRNELSTWLDTAIGAESQKMLRDLVGVTTLQQAKHFLGDEPQWQLLAPPSSQSMSIS